MELAEARRIGRNVGLDAPREYWTLNLLDLKEIIGKGGCGPGKVGDFLIPDTVWFLSIKPACAIHDWQYHFAKMPIDKVAADNWFLMNMVKLINKQTKFRLLRILRRRRAIKYYNVVVELGHGFTGES